MQMIDILTRNSYNTLSSVLESMRPNQTIDFYVMPLESTNIHFKLLSYVIDNEVKFIKMLPEDVRNSYSELRMGTLLRLSKNDKGEADLIYIKSTIPKWKTALKYNGTKFCYGQSILVEDYADSRKITKSFCKEFDKNENSVSYRVIVGGSFGDSLYDKNEFTDKTVVCDGLGGIDVQLKSFYSVLTKAMQSAWNGKNVVFAFDSMTRLVKELANVYTKPHFLPGGVSSDALSLVSNIFKMAGSYEDGTLMILGICSSPGYDNANTTIYRELIPIANGHIYWENNTQLIKIDGKTLIESNSKVQEAHPYVDLFGIRFEY